MSPFHCFEEMCDLFCHKIHVKSQYLTKSPSVVQYIDF